MHADDSSIESYLAGSCCVNLWMLLNIAAVPLSPA